ncbi:helix-turn-helix domain-containing protein [Corynebacterium auriscanis]|uniref:helix-turn-helix domain-containing protein n=1 Tax=Corynebacterium auriscanis TaxID=99807 RepID=UPI003CF79802
MAPGHEILTIKEFSAQYACSRSQFDKEFKAGRIGAKKLGKNYLIRRTEADEWFNSLPDATGGSTPARIGKVFSLPEAMKYIGCGREAIITDMRAGKLPAKKLGTRYRFRLPDLDHWFDHTVPDAIPA